jgi:hypothetical protein
MPATLSLIGTFLLNTWLGQLILSSALTWAVNEIFGEEPESSNRTQGTRATFRSTEEDLPILYGGPIRIGGNQVLVESEGLVNSKLWIVQTISEGECDITSSDVTVYLDDDPCTNTGGGFSGTVKWRIINGSSSQVYDQDLYDAIYGKTGYTENMRNTCYIVLSIAYNSQIFNSVPKITIETKGIKVYNLETGVTEWSDNVVLCLYDYMTNKRYGMGVDEDCFDEDSWIEAKQAIDALGWSYGRLIKDMDANEIIEDMLLHGRLDMINREEKFYLYHKSYETTPVLNIADEHICKEEQSGKALISIEEPSRYSIPEGLLVNFPDKTKEYVTSHIMIGESTGGKVEQIDLTGITDVEQARLLATYILERKQLSRYINGTFRGDCVRLEPNDVVSITTEALGITNWDMRIVSHEINENGTVNMKLIKENSNLYDATYQKLDSEYYTCNLPNPKTAPPNPTIILTEQTYFYRLRAFTRLFADYTASPDFDSEWVKHIEVWVSFDLGDSWKYLYNVDPDDFYIDNVEENRTYWFKFVTVSIYGVKTPWETATTMSHTIAGYSERRPSSLKSLVAIVSPPNNVTLSSNKVSDPDIELYEFRLGQSWATGIFLAASRAPVLSITGVKPGDHYFTCNTLSTNGLYGETPVTAVATLKDPPYGWEHDDSWQTRVDNFSGGTYNNAEISGGNLIASNEYIPYGYLDFLSDMKACWRLDSNGNDSIGTSHFTMFGSPSYVTGVSKTALSLNGTNQYASRAGTANDVLNPDDITIKAHVKANAFGSSEDIVPVITKNGAYCLQIADDGEVIFGIYTTSWDYVGSVEHYITNDAVRLTTGVFYCVIGTYESSSGILNLYIDDKLVATNTHSNAGVIAASANLLNVGGGVNVITQGSEIFYANMVIDEFVLFSRALGPEEALELAALDIYCGHYLSAKFSPAIPSPYETLFYILGELEVISTDNLWSSLITTSTTGRQLGMTSKSWLEIFEVSGGAKAEISVKYINAASIPSNWPTGTSEQKRLEIQTAVVTGRHFQIRIKIKNYGTSTQVRVHPQTLYFCEEV